MNDNSVEQISRLRGHKECRETEEGVGPHRLLFCKTQTMSKRVCNRQTCRTPKLKFKEFPLGILELQGLSGFLGVVKAKGAFAYLLMLQTGISSFSSCSSQCF